jgi:hypothetical protein
MYDSSSVYDSSKSIVTEPTGEYGYYFSSAPLPADYGQYSSTPYTTADPDQQARIQFLADLGIVATTVMTGTEDAAPEFLAPETTVPQTIGDFMSGVNPDTMIHLTPSSAADFAGGVDTGTYWARLGDVSHLTPLEYRVGVVGPAAGGYGPGANLFILSSPESAAAFQLESQSAFGYREFMNTQPVNPSGFISVPSGSALPYPPLNIPAPIH